VLTGMEGDKTARRPYSACADFYVRPGENQQVELRVPPLFQVYQVAAQVDELETPTAERQFARLVVGQIPTDVWDAGVAALSTGEPGARATAQALVERWWKRDEDQALDALADLGDRLGAACEALRFVRCLLPNKPLPEGHPQDTNEHRAARQIDAVLKEQ